ncbi:Mediator of RNA polymerase II transcription subunit 13 [Toxocara canis]|uniref:Mediator of RNA polymerase II transcription subunit 13 n=1 Tax=Toxocara canis TaxID=6265 RepID=A0A0B2VAY3_TOXCA|nr:Mediator of RNA polymerase II transcription subunit 13 [Toxocara canis]
MVELPIRMREDLGGEDGQGNWSVPGIQYETRTLFFKALHNLIERKRQNYFSLTATNAWDTSLGWCSRLPAAKSGNQQRESGTAWMSNSTKMTTNGGSLEDCHTNVFALTELNGLKWKCLTTPLSQRTWTSLEHDPVLSAYAKCLQAGILCAWRRQPPQPSSTLAALPLPDYRIDVIKELWVFWYSQEEPECLAQYTSHLSCGEDGQGNWSVPGIQYETRTLFFKALHNLIERGPGNGSINRRDQ